MRTTNPPTPNMDAFLGMAARAQGALQSFLEEARAVEGPGQFPKQRLPGLHALDTKLRCPLCGCLLEAPMVVKGCGHTYCSLCIRKHFNSPHARANKKAGTPSATPSDASTGATKLPPLAA